jgi:C1A family cysteine protease
MDAFESQPAGQSFRYFTLRGTPLSDFRFGRTAFRLADDPDDGGPDDGGRLPVRRDDLWQDMLRNLFGRVPEGAEHAPPCPCEIQPRLEGCNFAGLAGLPPAIRLMDGFFPVRDQSKRGACFAFALVALCEYMLGKTVELSEQSLFHFTKLVTPGKVEDLSDGAIFLDSIHAVEEYGICPLSEWHYNPESWNYVEDPYNEGQGKALQRKLEAAQPYRFRNWRTLSRGSVLQFKQALSSKRPIYTGVPVTTDWDDDAVRADGRIPYPKLFWRIRVYPPPRGLVLALLEQNDIEPTDESIVDATVRLMAGTLDYLAESVFHAPLSILESKEDENGIEIVAFANKIRGGHALCLAGYVDDESYPGGGYFIARNSWSDDKWAPESPEMPGYALLPYAYVADLGMEGVVMSDFPNGRPPEEQGPGAPSSGTAGPVASFPAGGGSAPLGTGGGFAPLGTGGGSVLASGLRPGPAPVRGDSRKTAATSATPMPTTPAPFPDFDAWLAAGHIVRFDRPAELDGVLLRPGTTVLCPDPSRPRECIRDTPENRASLRGQYLSERYFGPRSACFAAFGAARAHADSFLSAERARIGLLPGAAESDDLSVDWVVEKLASLGLPEGAVPPQAWIDAAAAACRAVVFRVSGDEEVRIAVASFQSFAFDPDAGLAPAPASAEDVNLLHRLVEAHVPPADPGAPSVVCYALTSASDWSAGAKGRLFGGALPVLVASAAPDGSWAVELPPAGRVPAARAALLDALVPVPEEELLAAVRETVDGFFAADRYSARIADVREGTVRRRPALSFLDERRVRSLLLSLQSADPGRYALCVNAFGSEELRLADVRVLGSCRRVNA